MSVCEVMSVSVVETDVDLGAKGVVLEDVVVAVCVLEASVFGRRERRLDVNVAAAAWV